MILSCLTLFTQLAKAKHFGKMESAYKTHEQEMYCDTSFPLELVLLLQTVKRS